MPLKRDLWSSLKWSWARGVNPNAHGPMKEAPLRFRNLRMVQLLLEHGADPNPQDADTIGTMDWVVLRGELSCTKFQERSETPGPTPGTRGDNRDD
jgi:hypothetical protein